VGGQSAHAARNRVCDRGVTGTNEVDAASVVTDHADAQAFDRERLPFEVDFDRFVRIVLGDEP
jgi:hypothetical protein